MPHSDPDTPPRAVLIAALAVAVVSAGAVLAIAARRSAPDPDPVPPAPQAGAPECRALLATLPERLGDFARTADPAPGAAAWDRDGQTVVLRCGVDRPTGFVVGAPIQVVDQVQWFGASQRTWVSVDRAVYVELRLPADSGPAPIQAVSGVIDRSMPAIPIRPGRPGPPGRPG